MTDLDLIGVAIHEAYGPPCDDFDPECAGCKTWAAFGRMQWQPIETAPKNAEGNRDGPPILLWNKYNHQIVHGFWTTHICNGMIRTGWAIWQGVETINIYPVKPDTGPTHWMPLPEPPEQNGTKA